MTTAIRGRPTNAVVIHRKNIKNARGSGFVRKPRTLPEYLESFEVETLIELAPSAQASLLFLIQWRTGMRVSEALALTKSDFILHPENPTVRVREGKGSNDRLIPVHPELAKVVSTRWITASNGLMFPSRAKRSVSGATVSRQTGHRWLKDALRTAVEHNRIPSGRKIATHTLRHSAARHWLTSGVAINVVSRWLGHASLQTTLIYLEILPDPLGDMARVP